MSVMSSCCVLIFFSSGRMLFSVHLLLLQNLAADLATADFGAFLAPLQGLLRRRVDELLTGVHSGEPEAVLIGEVVAGALGPVALNEGRGAEIFQAGAGRHQGLTATFSSGCCVLYKSGVELAEYFLLLAACCKQVATLTTTA